MNPWLRPGDKRPGDKPPFAPADVVLHSGDVVYLAARDVEVFFTGGLLPSGGGQVPIRVDLTRALCDARERIIVQPGDLLILQSKPGDAIARYLGTSVFNFNLTWLPVRSQYLMGATDVSAPQNIPARIGVGNFLTSGP
jgi:hypothetical protein